MPHPGGVVLSWSGVKKASALVVTVVADELDQVGRRIGVVDRVHDGPGLATIQAKVRARGQEVDRLELSEAVRGIRPTSRLWSHPAPSRVPTGRTGSLPAR